MAIYQKHHKREGITYYYIRFQKADGHRKVEQAGTTLEQARRLLKKRQGEVVDGTYIDPREVEEETGGPTFGEFAERFLEQYGNLRRSDHYIDRVKPLKAAFGERLLQDITQADLDGYAAARSRKVSASTVRKDLAVIGTMFKMAKRWGLLSVNPAADLVKPRERAAKTRYLCREEVDRLTAEAVAWLKPILTMAVSTGMRLKEVVGIRWEDWDREADALHLSDDNKTARTRTIPLNTWSRNVLAGQVRHVRSPFVFTDAEGKPHTSPSSRDRIGRETSAAMVRAKIDGATFKDLRHTAASLMVQSGVPLYEVQKILGHSTPLMTQRYAHLAPGHLRGAIDKLDAALQAPATQTATQPSTAAVGGGA
jgi:integrase